MIFAADCWKMVNTYNCYCWWKCLSSIITKNSHRKKRKEKQQKIDRPNDTGTEINNTECKANLSIYSKKHIFIMCGCVFEFEFMFMSYLYFYQVCFIWFSIILFQIVSRIAISGWHFERRWQMYSIQSRYRRRQWQRKQL